ncbi:MAG TPA: DNA-formamidopyrimidine glycosylase family protein [Casimicrobiaceae bacterium]|nr:DNA-formamidopyrimidine glycosylase family protein [Casimicrobiaceae bacterium]
MPELPDVELYREALAERVAGHALLRVELRNPFVLRTAVPPIDAITSKVVRSIRRLGKRIVLGLDDDYFLVAHLMIAGRLRWLNEKAKVPARITLAVLHFDNGRLAFTEAGSKRRASLHLVLGETALRAFDMGGLEVLTAEFEAFDTRLRSENHTLKRALTDPRLFSGIGNAYSDEILHRAKLSPLALTTKLDLDARRALYVATRGVLDDWSRWLRNEAKGEFPQNVTAFRPGMAVHGRYGQPCPVCGSPVQRIVYAENEANYCATCQTGGRLLADRSLSRLLHDSWPKSIDELG